MTIPPNKSTGDYVKIYTIGPDYYLNGNFDRIPAGQYVLWDDYRAAKASAAQANVRAKVEADEGNKLARLVVDLQAQVDALRKRSEVVERMALAPGMKTNLALQADLEAATARCERYEKALEESRKATAYFSNVGGIEQNKVDALQAQVDALRKELTEAYAMRADAIKQANINRDQVIAANAQVDALTKERDASREAYLNQTVRWLDAEEQYKRYLALLKRVNDFGYDRRFPIARHIREAIAEQALANDDEVRK